MTTDTKQWEFIEQKTFLEIDWNQVKTLEDLKLIIKSLDIKFEANIPKFNEIRHLLKNQNSVVDEENNQ